MPVSLRRAALALFLALLGFIAFATLSPIDWRPRTGQLVGERAGAFLLLAASLGVAWPRKRWAAFLACTAIAVALEAAQLIDPGRHGRVPDVVEKVGGAALGALLAWLVEALAVRWRR